MQTDLNSDKTYFIKETLRRFNNRPNYTFANLILRDIALVDPEAFCKTVQTAMKKPKESFFIQLWDKLGGDIIQISKDELLPKVVQLNDKSELIIIQLPKPELRNEPFFIGMLVNGSKRFYTLEMIENNQYGLCVWEQIAKDRAPGHFVLVKDVKPTLKDFHLGIKNLEI